jgi:hypothetical protein
MLDEFDIGFSRFAIEIFLSFVSLAWLHTTSSRFSFGSHHVGSRICVKDKGWLLYCLHCFILAFINNSRRNHLGYMLLFALCVYTFQGGNYF